MSHYQAQNLIPLSYATPSILLIVAVLLLVTIISVEKKPPGALHNGLEFSLDTTRTFRGIAVLFLILGHFSNSCVDKFKPLYWAGEWAVIVFLFVSGIGLSKKGDFSGKGLAFFRNRAKRLLFPVWITLFVFYVLGYSLLD